MVGGFLGGLAALFTLQGIERTVDEEAPSLVPPATYMVASAGTILLLAPKERSAPLGPVVIGTFAGAIPWMVVDAFGPTGPGLAAAWAFIITVPLGGALGAAQSN